MYVNAKVTVWQKIRLSETATKEQIVNILQEYGNTCQLFDEEIADDYETMTETEEQVEPFDNGGYSTLELCDDDGNILWVNGTI